ncbi:hypothetical protein XENOCAPTIV_024016 [Xenoophorus captivus]|uniref:Uncharacterized protein n=1 Tax=Xenoophorus captivus TaxID=1517983 RepID=A0ABV0QBA0_9TELE
MFPETYETLKAKPKDTCLNKDSQVPLRPKGLRNRPKDKEKKLFEQAMCYVTIIKIAVWLFKVMMGFIWVLMLNWFASTVLDVLRFLLCSRTSQLEVFDDPEKGS